ncbi:MAG: DUF2283 domain-containing protein [Nitrospirae bacterium]|nr:DUF2283 domain-containing protein [Nitrospirota bacterium]
MKIEYDQEVDALYIRVQEKHVARTQEITEGVNVDFDDEGKVIGKLGLNRVFDGHSGVVRALPYRK